MYSICHALIHQLYLSTTPWSLFTISSVTKLNWFHIVSQLGNIMFCSSQSNHWYWKLRLIIACQTWKTSFIPILCYLSNSQNSNRLLASIPSGLTWLNKLIFVTILCNFQKSKKTHSLAPLYLFFLSKPLQIGQCDLSLCSVRFCFPSYFLTISLIYLPLCHHLGWFYFLIETNHYQE